MIERFSHQPKKLTIFVGAYGSGKSEVSVNFAAWLAETHKVYLADLDMINPFYRSADARQWMNERNINLISSIYAGTQVDVPAVPAEINRIFADDYSFGVLDIGGEDLGSRVVASIKPQISTREYDLFMVVNPYRPFTDTAEKIHKTARDLEKASGLKITGMVFNANLLEFSNVEIIKDAWPVMLEASDSGGYPVVFLAAMAEILPSDWSWPQSVSLPVLHMQRTIHYPTE
jgi:MinD-like ATPase involved in chromosome partitioning or flagellar assembly